MLRFQFHVGTRDGTVLGVVDNAMYRAKNFRARSPGKKSNTHGEGQSHSKASQTLLQIHDHPHGNQMLKDTAPERRVGQWKSLFLGASVS
jgi:hypothetical protein